MFNDARIVRALEDYVCAADEVWRLQRGSDADCVFFQRAMNGGERITDGGTRQGTWIFSPSGKLLTANHHRSVDSLLRALERGRAAFQELGPEDRRLPADAQLHPEHRWEHSRPEGGLVLRRHARDLGPEGLGGDPSPRWNVDMAWFSAAEVRAAIPAAVEVGDRVPLGLMAERLARLHLVDNTGGQTLPFAPEEIRRATLFAAVESIADGRASLRLEGSCEADADGVWRLGHILWKPSRELAHGIATGLIGRAEYDLRGGTFESFELVGLARRWGFTENNARWRSPEPGALAFHLELAAPDAGPAPTFIDRYGVDWVVPPRVGTWIDSPSECDVEGESD